MSSSANSAGAAQPSPNPPRNDPITTKELSLHNGQDPSKPIWVAVKGTVFDVSRNKDAYGMSPLLLPFAGKGTVIACAEEGTDTAQLLERDIMCLLDGMLPRLWGRAA